MQIAILIQFPKVSKVQGTLMVLPEDSLLAFIFSVYAHICGKDGEKPL